MPGEMDTHPLNVRIDEIRDIVTSTEKLQEALVKVKPGAAGSEHQWGLVAGSLENHQWEDLELDLDRNKAEASHWYYDPDNGFKDYVEGVQGAGFGT